MIPENFEPLLESENIIGELRDENASLDLLVNLEKECRPSQSGKNTIIAETKGWKEVFGSGFHVMLMLFKKQTSEISSFIQSIENGVDVDKEMGFKIFIHDRKYLKITCDFKNEIALSKSGKSMTVASSEGLIPLGDTGVTIKIHVYRKLDKNLEATKPSAKIPYPKNKRQKKE